MTAEHLKGLLESVDDSLLLAELANSLAQADVPPDIVRALRWGRITALQKPDNGVRDIVGEFICRLVARTLANIFRSKPKKRLFLTNMHWKPECVAYVIQTLTDLDDNATVVSEEGVGAFDLTQRKVSNFCLLQSCSTAILAQGFSSFVVRCPFV